MVTLQNNSRIRIAGINAMPYLSCATRDHVCQPIVSKTVGAYAKVKAIYAA